MRSTTLSMFLLLLLLPAAAISGGVYRWVDAKGQLHFGDQPVGVEAQQITVRASKPDPASVERLKREQESLGEHQARRSEKREQAAKVKEEQAEREKRCVEARYRLMRYTSAPFLYEPGKDGERRVLSDAERKQSEDDTRAAIKQFCG